MNKHGFPFHGVVTGLHSKTVGEKNTLLTEVSVNGFNMSLFGREAEHFEGSLKEGQTVSGFCLLECGEKFTNRKIHFLQIHRDKRK